MEQEIILDLGQYPKEKEFMEELVKEFENLQYGIINKTTTRSNCELLREYRKFAGFAVRNWEGRYIDELVGEINDELEKLYPWMWDIEIR
jgi:hypothetical protein